MIASGQGSPLTWAYIHRLHHKHPDTDLDPQSPLIVGKINTLFSRYTITKFEPRLVRDILKNNNLMMLHNHWYKFAIGYAICWSLIDPILMLYIVGTSSIFCSLLIGIFNTVSHRLNTSNNGLYSLQLKFPLLLWGENEHMVHHLNPAQLQLSRFDIGFYLIKLMKK
jgi:fatty-acid desaturase